MGLVSIETGELIQSYCILYHSPFPSHQNLSNSLFSSSSPSSSSTTPHSTSSHLISPPQPQPYTQTRQSASFCNVALRAQSVGNRKEGHRDQQVPLGDHGGWSGGLSILVSSRSCAFCCEGIVADNGCDSLFLDCDWVGLGWRTCFFWVLDIRRCFERPSTTGSDFGTDYMQWPDIPVIPPPIRTAGRPTWVCNAACTN